MSVCDFWLATLLHVRAPALGAAKLPGAGFGSLLIEKAESASTNNMLATAVTFRGGS